MIYSINQQIETASSNEYTLLTCYYKKSYPFKKFEILKGKINE